jgi:hypothetical protein
MKKILLALIFLPGCAMSPVLMASPKLIQASYLGDADRVKQLIADGADVNVTTHHYTPLLAALAGGRREIVPILLAANADPNIMNENNYTPLASAVNQNFLDTAKLLIEHGARVDNTILGSRYISGPMRQVLTGGMAARPAAAAPAPVAAAPSRTEAPATSDVDRVPSIKHKALVNAYALVIGVESYREKLPKADYAASDAKLMGEYLVKVLGFPEENVVVRTDDKASLTDFMKYVENWLPNNVEKDAKVFVYFSGHGAPNPKTGRAFLVPYDGDPTFIESTGYPVERLYAALDKLPTSDVSVVLDSCFSGAGGRSVLAKGARPLVQVASVTRGTRASVLSAGASDQISNAYEEKGHGLLTYFLLKAYGDGITTLSEAFAYARPNVQRVARKLYNNEQTPQYTSGKR